MGASRSKCVRSLAVRSSGVSGSCGMPLATWNSKAVRISDFKTQDARLVGQKSNWQ